MLAHIPGHKAGKATNHGSSFQIGSQGFLCFWLFAYRTLLTLSIGFFLHWQEVFLFFFSVQGFQF